MRTPADRLRGEVVTLRLLSGQPVEVADLQRVLEAAPTYTQRVTGQPVGPHDGLSVFTSLPAGKSASDKFVFGVVLGEQMVGCIDLIRAYPDAATAHVGLLLIAEPHQGRGLGATAYTLLEQHIVAWQSCTRVRLGVVRTNAAVLPFWHGLGFRATGEGKPYRDGEVESEVMVLTKALDG
jgi:RimJ/RimL family protein N-acetyltransferase